ncbi:hypothetical protein CRM22_002500 [Opisthorchis felineus]|uniref:MD-2-related lipid-recognition domain-containing protein n=1 Tax=Opisthorchis felineus TaxID=147828 RepID=A0A4S2MBQ7_OPIFE|nr:hypothetical protein CRM22_002500 [Opisthorchis felineus]
MRYFNLLTCFLLLYLSLVTDSIIFKDCVIKAEGHKIQLSSGHGPKVLKLLQTDVCAQVTPSCPIEKGKIYTLRYKVMVSNNSPIVSCKETEIFSNM